MYNPLQATITSFFVETQEGVSRAEELGNQGGFVEVQNLVYKLDPILKELFDNDFTDMSPTIWQPIVQNLASFLQLLHTIKTYTLLDSGVDRTQIISQARDLYQAIFDSSILPLAYFRTSIDTQSKAKADAEVVLENVKGMESEAQEIIGSLLTEIGETLGKAKEVAATAGIAAHAAHFKQEADGQQKGAYLWLFLIVAACGVIGYMALKYIPTEFANLKIPSGTKNETAYVLQFSVIRLFQLFPFLYALVFCAKNYAASQHNVVANRHRQHALSTFETFAKAATDDATKNQVLTQATQAIFAPQATGYIAGDTDMSGGTQVFEVIKTMVGTAPATKA